MREHVENIAFLGVDNFLHLDQSFAPEPFFGKSLQKFFTPRIIAQKRKAARSRRLFYALFDVNPSVATPIPMSNATKAVENAFHRSDQHVNLELATMTISNDEGGNAMEDLDKEIATLEHELAD